MSINKYTTQEVLNKVYTDESDNTISLQAQTAKETLNAVLSSGEDSLNVSLAGSNTITGDVTISGDLTVNGNGGGAYDEIVNGDLHVKSDSGNSTDAFLVEKNDGTDVFIIDTTNSNVKIPNGILTLGTADSTSGHINAFENMSFNIDTDNDDTTRFFEFAINGASGAGTELMRLTEAGQLGIGSSAPDAWSYTNPVLTLSGGTTANNYVAFNLGAYSTSTTGILGDINFTQFASDGTTGAERAIVRAVNDGATDSVALKFLTTPTGGAVTERLKIDSSGNVGIGTASPSYTLDLSTSSNNMARFNSSNSTGGTLRFAQGGNNKFFLGMFSSISGSGTDYSPFLLAETGLGLSFGVNGTASKVMTIDSSGNVGIGTTSPKHYSGTTGTVLSVHSATHRGILELSGASNSDDGIIGAVTFANTENDADKGALAQLFAYVETNDSNGGNDSGGHLAFLTRPDGGTITERMRINSAGSTKIFGNQFIEGTDAFLQFHDTGETGGGGGEGVHTILSADDKLKFMGREDDASAHVEGFSLLRTGDVQFHKTITIDSNATDGTALTIDSEAQDGQGIYMDVSQQTTGYGINIADSGNSRTTGGLLYINSNQNNSGTRNVVDIINNHTGATNATALMVTQKAAVQAVKIDQDGNGDGLLISTDATTRHGLYVDGSAFTTGNGAYIYSNASNDSTRNLMLIVNDNAGATGATGLKIQQDSTAPALVALGNVGIGTSSPSDYNSGGNNLVIYENGHSGITIASGTSSNGSIHFADGTTGNEAYRGVIAYSHSSEVLQFATVGANNGYQLKLDQNSKISLSNNDGSGTSTVFGSLAGRDLAADGNYNTFVGDSAGLQNKLGINNVALGHNAMDDSYASDATDAENDNNVFIGYNSGGGTWTGSTSDHACHDNIGIGTSTMVGQMQGAINNIGIGSSALTSLTEGTYNVSVGALSLDALTTGSQNTAIGDSALGATVDGASNTAVGAYAMSGGDAHIYNTAIGCQSLSDATGSSNTALGFQSGNTGTNDITSGSENTLIGSQTSASSSTASNQIVVGKGEVGYGDFTASIGGTVLGLNVPNTMPSPYYRFDGTNDQIDIADNVNLDLSDALSIECLFKTEAINTYQELVNKADGTGAATSPYRLNITNGGLLNAYVANGSSANTAVTSSQLTAGQWYHAVFTADGSNLKLYLNGTLVDTESQSITPETQNGILTIGRWGDTGGEYYPFLGEMQKVRLYNKALTATEVKEMYSGASVPFKYKGANQTSMINNGDFSNGATTGFYGGWSHDTSNNEADYDASGNDESQLSIQGAVAFVKDKEYQLVFTVANVSSGALKLKWFIGSDEAITQADYTNGTHTVLFTSPVSASANFTAKARNSGQGGSSGSITNVALTRAGAVAEYDGSSAGEKVWGDKSGNSLDGTVSGATLENTPYDAGTEYEEGTFDPVWVAGTGSFSGTISYQNIFGKYVKIGNAVHITLGFYNNAFESTGGSGSIKIGGLPYTASAKCALTLGDTRLFNDDNPSEAEVGNGTTNVILYIRDGNADVANTELQVADLATGSGIVANLVTLSGTYFT